MRRLAAVVASGASALALGFGVAAASPRAEVMAPRIAALPAPTGLEQQQIDELTRDGMAPLACGLAPVNVLTASGGAEKAATVQGEGFRRALAGMADSMSPQTPDNWVVLARGPEFATYGQREGLVGIGTVFGIQRRDGVWVFRNSGGCGPVGWADHRRADRPNPYTESPGRLRVSYTGGGCDLQPDTLQVFESERYVDVLLVSPPPPNEPRACATAGVELFATAALSRPVGDRTVRDISVIPAIRLPSAGQANE